MARGKPVRGGGGAKLPARSPVWGRRGQQKPTLPGLRTRAMAQLRSEGFEGFEDPSAGPEEGAVGGVAGVGCVVWGARGEGGPLGVRSESWNR